MTAGGIQAPPTATRPSAPTASTPAAVLATALERSAALHRHLCPRQVLGVRAGLLAGELLGVSLPQTDRRLLAFVETDGCFADGVGAATGCWLGRRTLRLIDLGKAAVTVVDTETARAIRLWPHPEARAHANGAGADSTRRWHRQLLAYQVMPIAHLLCWQPVTLQLSLAELISEPGRRVCCTRCGEEIMNQREVVRAGQPYCRSCLGDAYYHVTPAAGQDLADWAAG